MQYILMKHSSVIACYLCGCVDCIQSLYNPVEKSQYFFPYSNSYSKYRIGSVQTRRKDPRSSGIRVALAQPAQVEGIRQVSPSIRAELLRAMSIDNPAAAVTE